VIPLRGACCTTNLERIVFVIVMVGLEQNGEDCDSIGMGLGHSDVSVRQLPVNQMHFKGKSVIKNTLIIKSLLILILSPFFLYPYNLIPNHLSQILNPKSFIPYP
jgi:hypothetical protein